MTKSLQVDVAIVGGGPSGSTLGTLLKKYDPNLQVAIIEKEKFPRDHVGESLLPAVTTILAEMGVWDKVEAANFPIKLGATYRWGSTDDHWNLSFIGESAFTETERPGKFESQRTKTAFQVDRSQYDDILLEHAREAGCLVWMESEVRDVNVSNGSINHLVVREKSGSEFELKAKYTVDASGEAGVLRRALQIPIESPTALRNIAFWDYWQHAEWPERFSGVATRIQIMSLGWGWLWFIPITDTRTSVGLVLPAQYYKKTCKRPLELYLEAIQSEPHISSLLQSATREENFSTTKDWNFLSRQLCGDNWFLVGDSCGFADPILSAGLTLAQTSARKVAYSIVELFRGHLPPDWIKKEYNEGHRIQILHHMRFADFWYAGNGCFSDLKEFCTTLAADVGLNLKADDAFAWLSTGGFALDRPGFAGAVGFPLSGLQLVAEHLTGGEVRSALEDCNCVTTNLAGATQAPYAIYENGKIIQAASYVRGDVTLPRIALFELLLSAAVKPVQIDQWLAACYHFGKGIGSEMGNFANYTQAAEALVREGWLTPSYNPSMPRARTFASQA